MSETVYSVLLVDDHPLLRKGVRQLLELEQDLAVVGEAANGEEALRRARELSPDLILLDLSMKGMDGIDTLAALRTAGVESRIVVFTVSDDSDDVISALKSGADGYLLKDAEPEELIQGLRDACEGQTVLSQPLAALLARSFREERKAAGPALDALTRRELQILKYIAGGLSNKLIARRLEITESTVKVHVRHLLKKLGFRSRVEAAVWMVGRQQ